ncbi:hypothetical protein [Arthrobacter sp. zg-Y844]|uniref:hypothetical protein n=1 Tax=Arthrobacter sp. zg-Y844 TaxID=2964612 RepID=UPI0021080172|nr:hypothetical protein [Arthrobacter sp. zg-Y844]MCQ1985318.1 hypothetical protein [Arthrobacter sp. zg-Y844]
MSSNNASRHRNSAHAPGEGWRAAVALAAAWWYRLVRQCQAALHPKDPERGDVPGWVMITLMSAILVAGLLLLVQPALERLFESAIEQVQP